VLRLRNKLLPLADLREVLNLVDKSALQMDNGFIVVLQVGSQTFGIVVDGVFHTEEIVVKPMASRLRHLSVFAGNTILGDGSVILIIDPNGIAQVVGTAATTRLTAAEHAQADEAGADQAMSLLVFRAGSPQQKAVPLSLVTRLEEVDVKAIELSNGRHMIQYRGQLMPLVRVAEGARFKDDGAQPLLVFSDEGRSMGLVVDEIVDIVEDKLDIQVGSDRPGVLGSAVIKGQATEIIDVGHFLPLAFEDWFRRKDMRAAVRPRAVLLVDDSAFFRNMLGPVLKAAGYDVTAAAGAEEALQLLRGSRQFDVLVTDIEMPGMSGFDLATAVRGEPRLAELPIIALSSTVSPQAIERGRQLDLYDFVAKFDRQGLVSALKEQGAEAHRAA
jgi:two-component system chemotaxis sensor kinase CheA